MSPPLHQARRAVGRGRRSVTLALSLAGLWQAIPVVAQTPITITPGTRHQTMVGFGGALTWYSNWIYYGNPNTRNQIKQLMFEDCGIDVLRLKNWYYPVDYPANKNTSNIASSDLEAFNRTADLYQSAKAANPGIQVLLSSWSPPANLKSNGARENGGTLASDANGFRYGEFAQYWVDCLDRLGWTPDYLSFQNEPGWVATWESCVFSATQGTNAGYAEASDAIWNAIKNRPDVPKLLGSEGANVSAFLTLNAPLLTRPHIAAHGYHVYNIADANGIDNASTITGLNQIPDTYGDRPNWMTEYSKESVDWLNTARVIHNTMVEADASAYIYWKLAWTDATSDSMIGLKVDGSYTVMPHYYTIKHYAKHIDKGYQRIGIGGGTANTKVSGYLSPDLTRITLVAINRNTSADQIQLVHDFLPIGSIAGYQSVTGNYYQTMAGLSASSPITLPAKSLTTLVLTLSEPFNARPVAQSASLSTRQNTDLPLVLQAYDSENEPLTYTIVSGPGHGTLSGSGANHTYSPATGYTGPDSFTFKVNDGNNDSNTATISITVNPPNLPPTVHAGTGQTVVMTAPTGSTSPVPGAYFEWSAANETAGNNTWTSATANSYNWTFGGNQAPANLSDARLDQVTMAYGFPVARATGATFQGIGDTQSATFEFVFDTDTDNGVIFESGGSTGLQFDIHGGNLRFIVSPNATPIVLSRTLTDTDMDRMIHVVGALDLTNDDMLLYLDGALVASNLNFSPNDWSGSDGAGLGRIQGVSASSGIPGAAETGDFTGKIALFRYYRNKVLTAPEVAANHQALSASGGAIATLAGTASDPDGPSALGVAWSVVLGPGTVTFGDPNASVTTANFTTAGTYVLRLTADDGEVQTTDDITITVLAATPYNIWSGGLAADLDSNHDGISNGIAWVLGAAGPNTNATALLPVTDPDADPDFLTYTYRRSDAAHNAPGTSITVLYSGTLGSWTTAVHDGNDIIITTTNDYHGSGVDKVEVKIRKTLAVANRLFCRISLTPP